MFDGYEFHQHPFNFGIGNEHQVQKMVIDKNGIFWIIYTDLDDISKISEVRLYNLKSNLALSLQERFPELKNQKNILSITENSQQNISIVFDSMNAFLYDGQNLSSYMVKATGPDIHTHLLDNNMLLILSADDAREVIDYMSYSAEGTLQYEANLKGRLSVNNMFYRLKDGLYFSKFEGNKFDKKYLHKVNTTNGAVDTTNSFERFRKFKGGNNLLKSQLHQGTVHMAETARKGFLFLSPKLFVIRYDDAAVSQPEFQNELISSVTDLLPFSEKIMWVGSSYGLFKISSDDQYFKKRFQRQVSYDEKIRTRGIYANDQNIYAATEYPGGLIKEDFANPGYVRFPLPDKNLSCSFTLLPSPKGLYVATTDGIFEFDTEKEQYKKIINYNLENKQIWSFYKTEKENFYLGSSSGKITRANKKGEVLTVSIAENRNVIPYQILMHESSIWVSSNIGLFQLDSETLKTIKQWDNKTLGVGNAALHHINIDPNGDFWISTGGSGVVIWNDEQGILKRYDKSNGLSDNHAHCSILDASNYYWISTNRGLNRLNPVTGQINIFLESSGISENEFNRLSFFKKDSNTLFFGGQDGVTEVNSNLIPKSISKTSSDLKLLSSKKVNRDLNEEEISFDEFGNSSIHYFPSDRELRFKFTLLNYGNPDLTRYRYRLIGKTENEWTEQKTNEIIFSYLPYGKYTLEIQAHLEGEQWLDQNIEIPILVEKPFYLRPWAILSFIIIIIGLLFLLYKWRIDMLKKREVILKKAIKEATLKLANDKNTIESQAKSLQLNFDNKNKFLINIAHELKTPLTLIKGPINRLAQKPNNSADDKIHIEVIKENANQLSTLIDEIVVLSKLDNNKLELNPSPANVYRRFSVILNSMAFYAEENGIDLDYSIDPNLNKQYDIDFGKISRVTSNLLRNAIKFSEAGSQVNCKVRLKSKFLEVCVEDHGTGISAEDQKKVFERFYQSSNNDKNHSGIGIGLSMSKDLALLLGGSLHLDSALGKGSKFTFSIPITQSEIKSKIPVRSAAVIEKSIIKSNQELLIVEDNIQLREFIKSTFSTKYKVWEANNGKEALEIINTQNIGIIISDLMMPVMDGISLLKTLKADKRHFLIPFIMLTAKSGSDTRLAALRIGVDDFLGKPFDEQELIVRVENLLNNRIQRLNYLDEKYLSNGSKEEQQENEISNDTDNTWLSSLEQVTIEHMSDPKFNVYKLSELLALSRTQLFRKTKSLTGLSPNIYIREVRLQKAKEIIESKNYSTIKEVAITVGILKHSYFSELYRNRFGKVPSDS